MCTWRGQPDYWTIVYRLLGVKRTHSCRGISLVVIRTQISSDSRLELDLERATRAVASITLRRLDGGACIGLGIDGEDGRSWQRARVVTVLRL